MFVSLDFSKLFARLYKFTGCSIAIDYSFYREYCKYDVNTVTTACQLFWLYEQRTTEECYNVGGYNVQSTLDAHTPSDRPFCQKATLDTVDLCIALVTCTNRRTATKNTRNTEQIEMMLCHSFYLSLFGCFCTQTVHLGENFRVYRTTVSTGEAYKNHWYTEIANDGRGSDKTD